MGQEHHPARRGTSCQPWLRHGTPQLRHVRLLLQPGSGPAPAVEPHREVPPWACTCSPRSSTRRSPSPTLAPSTSTSPSPPRSRATTLVCPRRDPSSPSTTATKRRMTRNRKIHPDNPNSIFLLTKKKKTYNM